jgi:hypothetical protein
MDQLPYAIVCQRIGRVALNDQVTIERIELDQELS